MNARLERLVMVAILTLATILPPLGWEPLARGQGGSYDLAPSSTKSLVGGPGTYGNCEYLPEGYDTDGTDTTGLQCYVFNPINDACADDTGGGRNLVLVYDLGSPSSVSYVHSLAGPVWGISSSAAACYQFFAVRAGGTVVPLGDHHEGWINTPTDQISDHWSGGDGPTEHVDAVGLDDVTQIKLVTGWETVSGGWAGARYYTVNIMSSGAPPPPPPPPSPPTNAPTVHHISADGHIHLAWTGTPPSGQDWILHVHREECATCPTDEFEETGANDHYANGWNNIGCPAHVTASLRLKDTSSGEQSDDGPTIDAGDCSPATPEGIPPQSSHLAPVTNLTAKLNGNIVDINWTATTEPDTTTWELVGTPALDPSAHQWFWWNWLWQPDAYPSDGSWGDAANLGTSTTRQMEIPLSALSASPHNAATDGAWMLQVIARGADGYADSTASCPVNMSTDGNGWDCWGDQFPIAEKPGPGGMVQLDTSDGAAPLTRWLIATGNPGAAQITIDWGDGTHDNATSTQVAVQHTWTRVGMRLVHVRIYGADGGVSHYLYKLNVTTSYAPRDPRFNTCDAGVLCPDHARPPPGGSIQFADWFMTPAQIWAWIVWIFFAIVATVLGWIILVRSVT